MAAPSSSEPTNSEFQERDFYGSHSVRMAFCIVVGEHPLQVHAEKNGLIPARVYLVCQLRDRRKPLMIPDQVQNRYKKPVA